MKKIKEEKNIKFYINITYRQEPGIIIQTFDFTTSNKRYLPFIYDKRYLFKKQFEKLIASELLEDFMNRVDLDDKVIMTYGRGATPQKPRMAIINDYLPPYAGCSYCAKAKVDGDFLYCPEKDKHYRLPGIKRCPVFYSKSKVLT